MTHRPVGNESRLTALFETWNQAPSGNHGGRRRETKYLVIHYTGGESASGAIAWLRNPAAKASAHLVIDQQGRVTQLVDLDKVAYHAGVSEWSGDRGVNLCSIGIELVNPGPLASVRKGAYGSSKRMYREEELVHAPPLHGGAARAWAKYPEIQVATCLAVCKALHSVYGFSDAVGHDQVAMPRGRKMDPGPAFPMAEFRAAVLGA